MDLSSVQPTYSTLPEDIMFEILYRLPVKSLLRFRCVCKTWNKFIITPFFMKNHLACQKTSSNKYILYEDDNLCMLLTDSDPLFDSNKHSKLYYTPQLFMRDVTCKNCDLRVYGVCNGLLCLSDCSCIGFNIHLWNPICRKTKRLPEPEISIKDEYGLNPIFGVSFGYYGDDYKVIAIAYVDNTYIVSIYSLSTNSWKIISTSFDLEEDDNEDNDIGLFVLATKFVDGTAYMVTSRRVIVYFELNHETIGAIKFPEEFHAIGITMEVYEETIAVLGHANNYLSMWILRDKSFSSTSSWEKKFSVRLQEPGHHQAVGFLNNGKYLIRTFNFAGDSGTETKLILCDLECPKMTEFRSLVEFCSSSRRRLPPKYPTYHGRIHSSCMESFLLLNEDSVHPFVKTEIESSCSSILLTLQWDATLNAL